MVPFWLEPLSNTTLFFWLFCRLFVFSLRSRCHVSVSLALRGCVTFNTTLAPHLGVRPSSRQFSIWPLRALLVLLHGGLELHHCLFVTFAVFALYWVLRRTLASVAVPTPLHPRELCGLSSLPGSSVDLDTYYFLRTSASLYWQYL